MSTENKKARKPGGTKDSLSRAGIVRLAKKAGLKPVSSSLIDSAIQIIKVVVRKIAKDCDSSREMEKMKTLKLKHLRQWFQANSIQPPISIEMKQVEKDDVYVDKGKGTAQRKVGGKSDRKTNAVIILTMAPTQFKTLIKKSLGDSGVKVSFSFHIVVQEFIERQIESIMSNANRGSIKHLIDGATLRYFASISCGIGGIIPPDSTSGVKKRPLRPKKTEAEKKKAKENKPKVVKPKTTKAKAPPKKKAAKPKTSQKGKAKTTAKTPAKKSVSSEQ